MAYINQVMLEVYDQFFIPAGVVKEGESNAIGESVKEQIEHTLKNQKERIAVVVNVLLTSTTKEGNLQHYYFLVFPFSKTPKEIVLMTNQNWLPIEIQGRKTLRPEESHETNGLFGQKGMRYKDVDFEKEFTEEDLFKGLK